MPFYLLLFSFLCFASDIAGQDARSTAATTFNWQQDSLLIDDLFERYSDERPGAAFMVIMDDDIVAQKAYGYADLKNRVKTSLNTNYRLASATKQFTAMAILMLVHQKKLRLQSKLTEIFEDFPAYGAQISVYHLLRHRSGLVDYMELMDDQRKDQILDAEILELMKAQDSTLFVPGSRCLYSNSAYAVLAMIIEKISGMSYADFMKEQVFVPLGMMNSSVYQLNQPIKHRAFGYSKVGQAFRLTDQSTTSAVQGDGGIYTSVIDYRKWDEALYSNQLIPLSRFQKSLIPHVDNPDYNYQLYADGWRCDYLNGHNIYHHSGHTKGFTNYTLRIPSLRLCVVVLSNRNNDDAVIYIGNTLAALFSDGQLPVFDLAVIDAVFEKEGWQQAVEQFKKHKKAPALFFNSDQSLLMIAKKLKKAQKFQDAIEVLNTQIKLYPHSFESYFVLGQCYASINQPEKADAMYQKALMYIPDPYAKVFNSIQQKLR